MSVTTKQAPPVRPSSARASGPKRVVHLSVDERVALGRAARTAVPRSSHAGFEAPAERPDPIGPPAR